MLGKEFIGPRLVVRASASTTFLLAFTENAPQTHANPLVKVAKHRPVTMTKVLEPALKLRFQPDANHAQAVAVAAVCQLTEAVFELLFAFRPGQAELPSKRVSQKIKSLRRRIHDLGLRRVQRQAVVIDPR